MVEKLLRASDGEGRNQHLAAFGNRLLEQVVKFVERCFQTAVVAVSVSGFDKNGIKFRVRDFFRIAQNGNVGLPEVSGKQNRFFHADIVDAEFDACRAEQVPGFDEAGFYAGSGFKRFFVIDGGEQREHALHVLGGVERFDKFFQRAGTPAVFALSVGLLQVRGIKQNEFGNFDGRLRGVNFFGKTGFDEKRQASAVVEVRVRQNHGVQLFHGDSRRNAVCGRIGGKSLKDSAVDEDFRFFVVNEEAGAGHAAGGTVGYYSHGEKYTLESPEKGSRKTGFFSSASALYFFLREEYHAK